MRFRLTNSADTHVLYDPRELPPRVKGAPPLDLAAETARGTLLAFSAPDPIAHDDDRAKVDVFVDEPVDPELERRAGEKKHGLLRVPSGQLVLADADNLAHLIAGKRSIPPGNYDVTWFATEWDEEHRATYERVLGPITGVLIVLTFIALAYGGCASITSDASRTEVWQSVRGYALGLAAAWLLVLFAWRVTGAGKASAARAKKQAEDADLVVHLRPGIGS